jgi:citrate lyase subunit beta/citryl-CoA lyase
VIAALLRPRRALLYVRVNAVDTEFCYGDLAAIVRPGLDGVILPKVESAAGLATADWLLAQLEREQGLMPREIDLVPITETAPASTRSTRSSRPAPGSGASLSAPAISRSM